MAVTRLILIEGMIGAGKTTTAAKLAEWLVARGEDARAYHEFEYDHPIRTKAVDLLRATSPENVASLPDTGEDGLARDPAVYAVDQWRELAQRCRRGRQTVILESTFLQNSVMPSFTDGAPAAKVREVFAGIETYIAAANPILVYLRPSDAEHAVKRIHSERGEPWASWNVASVSNCPWTRERWLLSRSRALLAVEDLADLLQEPAAPPLRLLRHRRSHLDRDVLDLRVAWELEALAVGSVAVVLELARELPRRVRWKLMFGSG